MDFQSERLPPFRQPETTLSRASSITTLVGKELASETCSVRSFSSEENLQYLNQARAIRPSSTESILHWTLKFLGVTSAVLFGVWAPISYRLQVAGNKSNDDAQDKLLERVEELVRRVEGVEEALGALGRLRALEFCDTEGRKTLPACQSLSSSINLSSLLKDLGTPNIKHAPSTRRRVSSPPASLAPTSTSITRSAPITTTSPSMSFSFGPEEEEEAATSKTMINPTPMRSMLPQTSLLGDIVLSDGCESLLPHPHSVPEVGRTMQMAVMIGFGFGVLVCLAIAGGRRVVRSKRVELRRGRGTSGKGGSKYEDLGEKAGLIL